MKHSRLYRTQVLNAVLQLAFYGLSFIIIYLCYAFFNIGLQRLSRTAITTAFTFFICLPLFSHVYGAFKIGPMRKRQLIANSVCTLIFADAFTFIMLQVMNTNPQNTAANAKFVIFDHNLPLTALALALQSLLVLVLTNAGYRLYRRINPPSKCVIVASTQEAAEHVARKIHAYPFDFQLVDVVSWDCSDRNDTILQNEIVFVADIPQEEIRSIKRFCYDNDKRLYEIAQVEDVVTYAGTENVFVDLAFQSFGRRHPSFVQLALKRIFDVVVSGFLLVILSPLLLIVSLVLAFSGNGSVIFRQERRTYNGKVFKIMKFRTMYKDTDRDLSMKQDDDRITPVGRLLRKYRIDELPQLINILKGDMSLVGPRPQMLSNVEKYLKEVPEFRYREQMRAGITGLAQLDGRYDTSPKDKAILDLMYIEQFSVGLDMKLILRTFTVFFRHDAEGFRKETNVAPEIRRKAHS